MRPEEPIIPSIQTHVEPEFGACEEEVGGHGVFFERMDKTPDLVFVGDVPPILPMVFRPVDVGGPIPASVILEDHVGGSAMMLRGLDMGDPGSLRDSPDSETHLFPMPAPGTGEVDPPVVAPHPDEFPLHRAGGGCHDRSVWRQG